MFSKIAYAGLAVVFGVALVAANLVAAQDQDNVNAKAGGQEIPHYRAKQILGAKVALEGETSVGTVDDIVLDENGNVDYLIVVNSKNQLVTVPWDATRFNVEKRIATVQIPQEQFQKVPTYTAQQYPAFATPAYRTQVYKYYGLTPGQTRRAIRRGN